MISIKKFDRKQTRLIIGVVDIWRVGHDVFHLINMMKKCLDMYERERERERAEEKKFRDAYLE
jgi:hypothetical protein